MRKTKQLLALTAGLVAAMMLSSCGMHEEITINDDFSANMKITSYVERTDDTDAAEIASGMKEMGFTLIGEEEINGKLHDAYVIEETQSKDETAKDFISYDSKKIVFSLYDDDDDIPSYSEEDMDLLSLTVNVPGEIKLTNCNLSDDNKSVSIDLLKEATKDRYYIVLDDSIVTDRTVKLNAVNGKYYNKKFTLKADSENVITKFTVNDKAVSENEFAPSKDGRYNVYVELLSGASKKISYVLDRTKPYCNIVNGKTYKNSVTIKLSDKYGIKKAYLNGKSVKSGRKVTKSGTYSLKVYDKAGNLTTKKFKLKLG